MRIKFQGGEPTLRKDFRELCSETQRSGILTAVITNGQSIPDQPELLDFLDEIVFSLDAVTPEINDAVRGAGSHARVVAAIDLARQRNIPIYINMVVTLHTLPEIEAMLDFCETRGIRLNAQPVIFGSDFHDRAARPIALNAEQIRKMNHDLAAWKRRGRKVMFSPETYERFAAWDDFDQVTRRSEERSDCMAGRFYINIEANGDVKPCIQTEAGFEPKNILRDGLVEALRHARHHHCGDCFIGYLNERKALFALRPSALMGALQRG
jgi:MoaA/NifB/PqqE/SkfB family radical SAM enzyme